MYIIYAFLSKLYIRIFILYIYNHLPSHRNHASHLLSTHITSPSNMNTRAHILVLSYGIHSNPLLDPYNRIRNSINISND